MEWSREKSPPPQEWEREKGTWLSGCWGFTETGSGLQEIIQERLKEQSAVRIHERHEQHEKKMETYWSVKSASSISPDYHCVVHIYIMYMRRINI